MPRRLAGTVRVDGTDDENWPETDEVVHKTYTINVVLDDSQPATALDIPDVKWGGECRVEVRVTARIVDGGRVQVEGKAMLFEGTSENTDDLEDQQTITMTVPRGGSPVHQTIQLRSSGPGGGDHAEVGFSLTNAVLEEP
jgi:hypothetical protein